MYQIFHYLCLSWLKIADFPNSESYDLQGGLISEKFHISKKCHYTTKEIVLTLSQSEKLSEIKPPLCTNLKREVEEEPRRGITVVNQQLGVVNT